MSLLKRLAGDTPPPPATIPSAQPMAPVAAPQPASPIASAAGQAVTPIAAPTASSAAATASPVMVKATDNEQLVELSLQITDRILASLGSSQHLDRTPESERMLQERFANYYRQMNATVSEGQIKQ